MMTDSSPKLATTSSNIDNRLSNYVYQTINRFIDDTKSLPELSQVLQINSLSTPTISGHTDLFYPSYSCNDLAEISKIKHVPIPQELIEQFRRMEYTCFMGLFTSISRAWLTIDNLIFFWNYEDGSDIYYHESLNETVLAVELFKPKKDTFPEGVDYGLCIATANYVVLLSVEFVRYTKGNGEIVNEMRVSNEPIYTINADNIVINTIKSSANGRLFMGAKDGCLYEFYYQNQTGWFSSQTRRINLSHSKLYYFVPSFLNFNEVDSIVQIEIDESRNILYTRSENNCIQVFYLGTNGLDTSKISVLNSASIANKAASLIDTNDKHIFMPIVHISSLAKSESTNINLIAITQFGIRLYFSLNPFDRASDPPSVFQLVHVRLAPNIDLGIHNRTGPITTAFSRNGTTLMINKRDEQNDSVLLLSNDLYLLHNQFKESKSIFDIDGRVWCMDEIEAVNKFNLNVYEQNAQQYSNDYVKLSSQLFDQQRRFVMITPQGCFIWNKLRPIDQMCYALIESNGANSDLVRLFFKMLYSRSEACALCLAVALTRLSVDNRISEWATQAYFIYGGEAEIRKRSFMQQTLPQQQQQQVCFNQTFIKNPVQGQIHDSTINHNDATQHQQHGGFGQTINKQPGNFTNMSVLKSPQLMSTPIIMRNKDLQQQQFDFGANSEYELIFSGKHDALYIYISRLLAPIWNKKLLYELNTQVDLTLTEQLTTPTVFASFTQINLDFYIEKLINLKQFIELNYKYIQQIQLNQQKHLTNEILNELLNNIVQIIRPQSQRLTQYTSLPLNTSTLLGITGGNGTNGGGIISDKVPFELEKQSIYCLKRYIDYLIEIFELWKILDEHKYHFVSVKLERQLQDDLLNMTIQNFLFSDYYLYEQLITALIHRYIDDNVSTDELNKQLKRVCPSLFTNENAIFTKACEKLKQALQINDFVQRKFLIDDALELIKQINFVNNLQQICDTLRYAQCYDALCDLCLNAAQKRDPKNIALHYYHNGEPSDDLQGEHYFKLRSECYMCIIDCLNYLTKQSKSISTQSQTVVNHDKITESINDIIDHIINKTKDELAHVYIFNWLIDINQNDKLFKLNSPYIESYLKLKTLLNPKVRSYLDSLWRYYDQKKDYLCAAQVLVSLAETQQFDITLNDRINYLTHAIVALQSSLKISYKEEENELKDKLDIALIQQDIYKQLFKDANLNDPNVNDALKQLNSQLFDITKLYIDFAEKFGLYECQLKILKTSRHCDQKIIEYLWKNIIANELDKMIELYPEKNEIDEQKNAFSNAVVSVAESYVDGDEKYFPLVLLIDSLEFISVSRGYGIDWTVKLFRQLQMQYSKLLLAYNQLYQCKDLKWTENASALVGAIYSLIDMFTCAPNSTNEIDRMQFLRIVKDYVPKYMNELVKINDELALELIDKFKALSHILDRM